MLPDGQLGEHQKSASFVSTHTNQSEDNIQLIQSSGSIEGHIDGEEEAEGHTQGTLDLSNRSGSQAYKTFFMLNQGTHRLEKYLNLEGFLEKSLNSTIFCRTKQC